MGFDLYNDTYDIFCEIITAKNAAILEIGCGPGNITKYLLNKNSHYTIKAIDISPNMIELAKQNNPSAHTEVMDIREIDKVISLFDGVICGFCIPYLSQSDCSKLISDCSNLLSDSGILYLSFVEGDYNNSSYQSGSSGDRMYFYYHSVDKLKKKLNTNSFEIIESLHKKYYGSDRAEEDHIIIIAKKTDVQTRQLTIK